MTPTDSFRGVVLPPNTEELLTFAEFLADEARHILNRAESMPGDVWYKSDATPVTDLDRQIEAHLRSLIEDRYPDHGVFGEEYGSRDLDADLVWVLDPIDGTAPFIAGIPVYGTLIGLGWHGRPFIGVVDHPATDDRWAGVSGSFARHNGTPVHTRVCATLEDAFVTNSNPDFLNAGEAAAFAALRSRVRYVQYGGSCFAYAMLASGRVDVALDANLEPFDIFAPAAVIEGAGGVVTDWDGRAIDLGWRGQILAAGCREIHQQAMSVLSFRNVLGQAVSPKGQWVWRPGVDPSASPFVPGPMNVRLARANVVDVTDHPPTAFDTTDE